MTKLYSCKTCLKSEPEVSFYKSRAGYLAHASCRACMKTTRAGNDPSLSKMKLHAATRGKPFVEASFPHPSEAPSFCKLCLRSGLTMARDHDHETGLFRDWVCLGCNARLRRLEGEMPYLLRVAEHLGLVGPED